jgi:hypothetical protein
MKKKTRGRGENDAELLGRLSAGLSEGEIQRVLAGALKSLDHAGIDRLLKEVNSQTAATLRRVLHAKGAKHPVIPGTAKVQQEWDRAWEDWNSRIAEASDEEGQYVIQEHHWEEPYFDPGSLALDLEPIAVRMRKILARVIEENIDPDFSFADAVQESMEEIESGLPEWIHPFENEGFYLEPQATACLIDWEWRRARHRGRRAFQFVDQLRELEAATEGLHLDETALARFIRSLDREAKEDVLKGIQAKRGREPWKQALEEAHSSWFQIYKELSRSGDRPSYLADCRARISQDWTLAMPVAKDLGRKKKLADVMVVCASAVRSFLGLREGEKWEPVEDLLVVRAGFQWHKPLDARLLDLLAIWSRSAHALQQEETAAALRLQSDLLKNWRNWDKAIAAFRCVSEPGLTPLRERLFAQWRELVADESVEPAGYPPHEDEPHWVHILADAAWKEENQNSFCGRLRRWLNAIERDARTLRRSEGALARLSLDLDGAAWLRSASPAMARLLAGAQTNDPVLGASRRKWLKRLGAVSLIPELLQFWVRNICCLVPDPAASRGSDYRDCADWARALRELNPTSSTELLHEWSVAHHRRRNLWRALGAKGLSVSPPGDTLRCTIEK